MIEQRLKNLDQDIKSLKSTMPIAGSLVDTFVYRKSASKTLQDNEWFECKARFVPLDKSQQGIVEMSLYREDYTSSPSWSANNPIGASISSGYSINDSGDYEVRTWGARSTGDGYTWEPRITVTVYGTIEGNIEFEWS